MFFIRILLCQTACQCQTAGQGIDPVDARQGAFLTDRDALHTIYIAYFCYLALLIQKIFL